MDLRIDISSYTLSNKYLVWTDFNELAITLHLFESSQATFASEFSIFVGPDQTRRRVVRELIGVEWLNITKRVHEVNFQPADALC